MKAGNFADAELIIDKQLQNKLKGTALLNTLRVYVNDYEKILKESDSDIEALAQDRREKRVVANRELRVEECQGKLKLAKQKLDGIKEIMESTMQMFTE